MENHFDAIIIGGSYSGLAAGMALGRALRQILILDGGKPCNRQTPHSHNFLTQDGQAPAEIAALARRQVARYETVRFLSGIAIGAVRYANGFRVATDSGAGLFAKKLVFATGIRDILPDIAGVAECWGISVLHCPYCHGYEVRNRVTGLLGNGATGFEFSLLLRNWTQDLTLYTNGKSTLTDEQVGALAARNIPIVETAISELKHSDGRLDSILFRNGNHAPLAALYARFPFEQHCLIHAALGCETTADGYIKVDPAQRTTRPGIYACGDNSSAMRTVASAVSSGTTAGMMVNKDMVLEAVQDALPSP